MAAEAGEAKMEEEEVTAEGEEEKDVAMKEGPVKKHTFFPDDDEEAKNDKAENKDEDARKGGEEVMEKDENKDEDARKGGEEVMEKDENKDEDARKGGEEVMEKDENKDEDARKGGEDVMEEESKDEDARKGGEEVMEKEQDEEENRFPWQERTSSRRDRLRFRKLEERTKADWKWLGKPRRLELGVWRLVELF